MTLRRVVVGADRSPGATAALEWALLLARGTSTEVVVVHASPIGDQHAVTMQELDDWCASLRDAKVAYRCTLVSDVDPRIALPDVAKEEDADLIVIGSRGRNTFTQLVGGSVGLDLVHHADRPVAIIQRTKSTAAA
jgi:nucleotide-binding universal stress UspA family protein